MHDLVLAGAATHGPGIEAIVGSVVLGIDLDSPWGADPAFRALVLYGVFPVLGASGIAMWQLPRLPSTRRGR